VTKLLTESRASTDPAKRGPIFAKMQDIVYHDGYSVPLNYTPSINAYHNYVKNWRTVATGWWWFKDMWIDK
jgi:ABC-type transport system substrate-binding protein